MLVYSFLAITLLLGLLSLQLIRRSFTSDSNIRLSKLLLGLSLAAFAYHYGTWIYISAVAKYVFGAAALAALLYSVLRRSRIKRFRSAAAHPVRDLILSALLLMVVLLYYTGISGPTPFARLAFPLRAGRYFVLQGGKGLPANVFHYNARRAVYAMDIVRLDTWGRRCSKVFSRKLGDYYIFGDTVYSPCDGIIRRAVSDNPDNIPPARKRGPNNLNGVVLEGPDYTVYLGHLQQYRVFVTAGQRVRNGQPLGLVGNSGMSLEPHLHIQVHAKSAANAPWYSRPQLFILFDDKQYLLFEEIKARHTGKTPL